MRNFSVVISFHARDAIEGEGEGKDDFWIIYLLCLIGFPFLVCRTLSEFWHWFVANVPDNSVDDGDVVFDLLFPLVLPEGDGDHR